MSSISEAAHRDELRARLDRVSEAFAEWREANGVEHPEPDPLIADLTRLLNDPRLPDALAESVRAQLGETVYQMRVIVGEKAA